MDERQKVLVVDDEPRNQRIICEVLEDLVDLKVASSGEEALSLLSTYEADLVLLDIMMPGIDGYEVCKRIKGDPKLALTKVILVSGKAMTDERLKGYESGSDDYMTKPFVLEELLAKVKVFLRLTNTERQLNELNHSLDEKVRERTQQLLDAEAKLVSAAKMSALGEMAGSIAHEINTPLGTISIVAGQVEELLATDPVDFKVIAEMLGIVVGTVKQISEIIQGLRTFSRDGNSDQFVSVPLKQIIEDTLILCRERMKNENISFHVDPISDDLEIYCRSVQISQVLLNLINNGCDAVLSLEDRWIRVLVERELDGVKISVIDSGPGIHENVLPKLFQPFFTTKAIGKGTGIGLSISKGIIDNHDGTISVDTNNKNTSFIIKLPLTPVDRESSVTSEAS
jgi:C4-dicarboxylate-specific signal transduction histidine kinase